MHCLFISSLLPDGEPRTGFEIANRSILRAFEASGVRVTKAGFRRPGAGAPLRDEILLGDLVIENAAAGRAQKARWVASAIRERLPVPAAKLRVLSRAALLRKLEKAGPFDALILNSVQMPAAYPFLLDLAPAIFVAHNVEHLSAAENGAAAANPLLARLYAREARLLRRIERRVCERAGAVLALSEPDLGPLGLAGDPKAAVLPLTVGHERPAFKAARTHDIGLIGTWSWAPNRVGLDWFLREVAPRLPTDLTVAIAGVIDGAPPPAPPSCRFLGRVPDAQAFVRASRVMALATRAGTGVQLKTLEMLEEGMPAVATRLALRGIDGERPAHLRVADDAAGFAAALTTLVEAERAGRLERGDGRAFAARRLQAAREAAAGALEQLAAAPMPRRRIGPVAVLAVGRDRAIRHCREALARPGLTRLAFANAHCVNEAGRDGRYRDALEGFDVLPDGVGLDIASRLLHGTPFPANLNGTDFVPLLLAKLAEPCRVALVGGEPGVAERAAEALRAVAGQHDYHVVSHGFFAPGAETQVVLDRLESEGAAIVLVALGVPAQERFIADHLGPEHARLAIGVGALFDFLAGRVPRAPRLVRAMRLEWGWRLAQEPRRMARRYVLGNPLFLLRTLRRKFGRP